MSEQEANIGAETTAPATEPSAITPAATQDAPTDSTPAPEQNKAPDWFMADKYTSIEDQARAQFDMQNKIGKHWCPPKEDYVIEGIEGFKADDPIVTDLKPVFKDIGLSQEGVNTILKGYQNAYQKIIESEKVEFQKQMTPEKAARINEVNKLISDKLPADKAEVLKGLIDSHEAFDALDYVFKLVPSATNVPSSTNSEATRFETTKDVEADKIKYLNEIKEGLKVEDQNYRNQLNQRFADAWKRENKK